MGVGGSTVSELSVCTQTHRTARRIINRVFQVENVAGRIFKSGFGAQQRAPFVFFGSKGMLTAPLSCSL